MAVFSKSHKGNAIIKKLVGNTDCENCLKRNANNTSSPLQSMTQECHEMKVWYLTIRHKQWRLYENGQQAQLETAAFGTETTSCLLTWKRIRVTVNSTNDIQKRCNTSSWFDNFMFSPMKIFFNIVFKRITSQRNGISKPL
jgi:hypothetical protein